MPALPLLRCSVRAARKLEDLATDERGTVIPWRQTQPRINFGTALTCTPSSAAAMHWATHPRRLPKTSVPADVSTA